MLISMNMITFNFKNQKGTQAFNVKVPSLFDRPSMTQSTSSVLCVYEETKNITHLGGDRDVSC